MSSHVPLSVVIITHERPRMLETAVESVVRQLSGYPADCELVVVDSSEEPSLQGDRYPLTYLHRPDEKPAATKRNTGAAVVENEWLVFMDDDCRMADGTLLAIGAAAGNADPDVAGLFGVTEFEGDESVWIRSLFGTDFVTDFTWAEEGGEVRWGPTSLAAFGREHFESVGGFDDFTSNAGGEDVDICIRLRGAGLRLLGVPDARVYHTTETWNSLHGNVRRVFRYGLGEGELMARHPEYTRLPRPAKAVATASVVGVVLSLLAGALPPVTGLPALVVLVGSWLVGKTAIDYVRHPATPPQAAILTVLRVTFWFGSVWYKVRYGPQRNLLRGFDWTFGTARRSWAPTGVAVIRFATGVLPPVVLGVHLGL